MKTIDYSKMTELQASQAAYAERCASHQRWVSFCSNVTAKAATYKTKTACRLMIGRLTAAWKRRGAYGSEKDTLENAVWEIRMRWLELHGMELDAKWA